MSNIAPPTGWDSFTTSGAYALLAIVALVAGVVFPPLIILYAVVGVLVILARCTPDTVTPVTRTDHTNGN